MWNQLPSSSEISDWREEVKQLVCFDREVRKLVSGLSHRLFQNLHLTTPVYNEVDALISSTPNAPIYVIHTLRNIVGDKINR